MNLREIGIKNGTDKVDMWHSFQNQSYLDIYEIYFKKYKDKKINILEIGVKNGNSINTWLEYFPNATIYGLDINPNCKKYETERSKIFIGSQDDKNIIEQMLADAGKFDIIIDDGSHINSLTIKSFELLFNSVSDGGLYIMEDLGCSYENLEKLESNGNSWDGELTKNKLLGVDLNHKREELDVFFTNLVHDIDTNIVNEKKQIKNKIKALHFWCYIAVIMKA
jgi:hypothetical protein